MASDPLTLGMRIRRARERARLSQEELATAVGASVRAVGDWENGRRKPRNRMGALEEVLRVRLDEEPGNPDEPTREDVDYLRERIRDVLGPGSDLEAALDAEFPDWAPKGRAAGQSARSGSGRTWRQSG
jgi:transcriptional regulator with XRE-family HTH domain